MATCPSCNKQFAEDVRECPEDGASLMPDEVVANLRDEDLAEGTIVGEYRIEGRIGVGGFGAVYAAEHPVIGKRAAIKVLHRRYSAELQVVSRFISEARAVNRIRHRNIVDVFSFGQLDDGRHFLAMELLDGQTLRELLDERGRLTMEEAFPIFQGIADALDAAHAAGIAHRDLKPDNVFVVAEREGAVQAKLLDFGIAKLMGDTAASHKTATGTAIGTPRYMAPEQCRGKAVDHRADLYSFGTLIFETLTGSTPFDGDSPVDLMFMQINEPPPPLSSKAPDLPALLDGPLGRLLAKSPAARPATAREGLELLAAAARTVDLLAAREAEKKTTLNVRSGRTEGDSIEATPPTRKVVISVRDGRVSTGDSVATARSGDLNVASDPTTPLATAQELEELVRRKERKDGERDVSHLSVETPRERGAPAGRSTKLVVGLGLAAAVILGVVWVTLPTDNATTPLAADRISEPTTTAAPTTTAPEVPAPVVTPAVIPTASPSTVPLKLRTDPDDVSVWLGDKELGSSKDPLVLPYGTQAVTLRLAKSGYADQTLTVVPESPIDLPAKLSAAKPTALGATPTKAPPTTTAKPAASAPRNLDSVLGVRE